MGIREYLRGSLKQEEHIQHMGIMSSLGQAQRGGKDSTCM
jgi:hypothetical protein